MSGPVRQLRESIAAALKPLGVETYDLLPDHTHVPALVVGLPTIGPSSSGGAVRAFQLPVTLVGERADFANAQLRLDDLQWSVWSALAAIPNLWLLDSTPQPIEVAGQLFPSVVFTVEAPTPC